MVGLALNKGKLTMTIMHRTRSLGTRRNGFLFYALSAALAITTFSTAQADTAPTPPTPRTQAPQAGRTDTAGQIAMLVKLLAQAQTPEEAHSVQSQLDALRSAHLSPTTQLLIRRAEKDLSAEKPDDAVEDVGDALALQPDQAVLWRTRAQMRLVAGNLKGAVADLGEALARDQDDAQTWSLLASVEEHLNDGQAALKAWQKATTLNPMLDRSHKRLDSLRIKAFGQPT
ncbi:tetratricopeptide repeat protein [Acetobacter ghanensis]|uniref:Uncharacterized protein n=2 Tax=Acetobacter ghanensis TaxID=431306 RepID=A0A0U5F1J4_9PROT|nr:hypothetical protein [Acetobacter ghanensis]GBQ47707.1 hypothetical protein AA18895_1145 [Acetobacter ghanensis DSM 18895]CEF54336.1 hypothetical protein AGA_725 [Acetobacter ghanensis]